jgi:hypothetical protein
MWSVWFVSADSQMSKTCQAADALCANASSQRMRYLPYSIHVVAIHMMAVDLEIGMEAMAVEAVEALAQEVEMEVMVVEVGALALEVEVEVEAMEVGALALALQVEVQMEAMLVAAQAVGVVMEAIRMAALALEVDMEEIKMEAVKVRHHLATPAGATRAPPADTWRHHCFPFPR